MNIAVVLRLMPSLGDELEVDDTGVDIDREIVEMVINEFDEQALEEAVLIKEATGATVTAVALRPTVPSRRSASPLPAVPTGRARRHGRDEPYDTRTAALAFARRCVSSRDLVLTGVQTPYDVFGQAAPYLAVKLGWPQANVVVGTTVTDDRARRPGVHRRTPRGPRPHVPAVVGVQSASTPPRYVRWPGCARP